MITQRADQELIPTGGVGKVPGDPRGRSCDWCSEPATDSFEIKQGRKRIGSARYIYACPTHYDVAARSIAPTPRKTA